MDISNTFHGLSGRLHKFVTYATTYSFKPVGTLLLIALLCLIGGMMYGGGGGSYAAASTTTDGDASNKDEGTGGKGEFFYVEGNSACARLNYDSAESLLTCQLTVPGESTSVNSVDLNMILSQLSAFQVTADTVVWIQVWGAKGGKGDGGSYGGKSGQAGYAQMITSISDLESDDYGSVLYFYLGQHGTHNTDSGGQGGASTILTNENLLANPSTNPDSSQILMIAGGAGGGGGSYTSETTGKDGGDGGIAFASTSSRGSGNGQSGGGTYNDQYTKFNGGGGGEEGRGGTGPSHNGHDGYGGRGGDGGKSGLGMTQWVNTGATPLTFSAGEGAAGDDLQNTQLCVWRWWRRGRLGWRWWRRLCAWPRILRRWGRWRRILQHQIHAN